MFLGVLGPHATQHCTTNFGSLHLSAEFSRQGVPDHARIEVGEGTYGHVYEAETILPGLRCAVRGGWNLKLHTMLKLHKFPIFWTTCRRFPPRTPGYKIVRLQNCHPITSVKLTYCCDLRKVNLEILCLHDLDKWLWSASSWPRPLLGARKLWHNFQAMTVWPRRFWFSCPPGNALVHIFATWAMQKQNGIEGSVLLWLPWFQSSSVLQQELQNK